MAAMDQYFKKMPADRWVQAQAGHELILRLFPQIRLSRKYNMPAHESDLGWPAIGNPKNHWSVYTCSPVKIEDYLKRHPHITHCKGGLNFKPQYTVDLAALELVIRKALAEGSTPK